MIFILSCKKEPSLNNDILTPSSNSSSVSYDTIFPLSYLPNFPSSYWKYVGSHNDTTIIRTDSLYKKDIYWTFLSKNDTFYVPVLNGTPIWGYLAHTGPTGDHVNSYPFMRILSDSLPVGSNWRVWKRAYTEVSRKVIVKDTTIIISGKSYYPTIGIEEYYSDGPSYYIWIAKRYFTKNIGMIREDLYNYADSTVSSRFIFDYHINH